MQQEEAKEKKPRKKKAKEEKPIVKKTYEKKKFNKTKFEKLCSLQCTFLEICCEMDLSPATLSKKIKENYEGKTFKEVFKEKRVKGFTSLRKAQFKLAQENVKMNIFLSKNYLGMTDTVINNNDEEVSKFENMILDLKYKLQDETIDNNED